MLLTRAPLPIARAFDLHVLGLPPAFILSQDQTLKLKFDPFEYSKDLIETCLIMHHHKMMLTDICMYIEIFQQVDLVLVGNVKRDHKPLPSYLFSSINNVQ